MRSCRKVIQSIALPVIILRGGGIQLKFAGD